MASGNVMFQLDNIVYSYPGNSPVLDGVSLNISEGERVCILGANGCGKTTLLKLLSGLIIPKGGNFKAFGDLMDEKRLNNREHMKNFHKRVGFVFQNSDVQLFCTTVMEEVAFGPLQLKLPREQAVERVKDIMALLGIEKLKDKAPFNLSGGEKKKVALASILALNPEVLILDEPTAGLDPRTQRWLVELLISLNRAGKTMVVSTHNLELVQEISDRSVVFTEDHRIAMDTDTVSVLKNVELLKSVNLVDEYYHVHSGEGHAHFHIHNY